MNEELQPTPRRVFISYSHEDDTHNGRVLELADRLRSEGVDARLDRYEPYPSEGWPRWMSRQVRAADAVLVVCTPTYKSRFDDLDPQSSEGRGVNFEGALLLNELYRSKGRVDVYPVAWGDSSDEGIVPQALLGKTLTRLGDGPGYELLYRELTGQREGASKLGSVRSIAPRSSGMPLNHWLPIPKITDYLDYMIRRWLALRLKAFEDERTQGRVTLDDIFIELDTTSRDTDGKDKALTALEVAGRFRRLLLLGDPGAGKTSFVHRLLARVAMAWKGEEAEPDGFDARQIPIHVVLRELAPLLRALEKPSKRDLVMTLLGHVEQVCQEMPSLAVALREHVRLGHCVVVLDGFDEVAEPDRKRVFDLLEAIEEEWQPAHTIVTCRIRSYDEATWTAFDVHRLAPFDKGKIRAFIAAWYRAQVERGVILNASEGEERIESLTPAVLKPGLAEMARNPMLLTTMAIVHSRFGELPRERAKLYFRAVMILALRWKEGQDHDHYSDELKEFLQDEDRVLRTLQFVAHRFHDVGTSEGTVDRTVLTEADLVTALYDESKDYGVAKEFLEYIDLRAGLLQGEGGGSGRSSYAFPHRTFQEYLAGCYLLQNHRRALRKLRPVSKRGESWNLAVLLGLEDLLYNTPSRGIADALELAYELHEDSPSDQAIWRRQVWSAHLASLVGRENVLKDDEDDLGPKYWENIRENLVRILEGNELPTAERLQAGDLLATMGDPRFDESCFFLPKRRGESGSWERGPMLGFRWVVTPEEEAATGKPGPFAMATYPVTHAQYAFFAKQAGQEVPAPGSPFDLPNHPVVLVSHHDACAYARWLGETLGSIDHLDGRWTDEEWELRLPREAEWEYAAKLGSDGDYPYPGDADPDRMNCRETQHGATSSVGCFAGGMSSRGIHDLAGNVDEWCMDGSESERVVRGGSWGSDARNCRSSVRGADRPGGRYHNFGFRLVLARVQSGDPSSSE